MSMLSPHSHIWPTGVNHPIDLVSDVSCHGYLFVSAVSSSTQSSICNSSTAQVCYDAVHMSAI